MLKYISGLDMFGGANLFSFSYASTQISHISNAKTLYYLINTVLLIISVN